MSFKHGELQARKVDEAVNFLGKIENSPPLGRSTDRDYSRGAEKSEENKVAARKSKIDAQLKKNCKTW